MPDQQNQTTAPSNTPAPAKQNETVMGILAYLGILIIIPFLMAKDDPFVKFHIKQGLLLVIGEIAIALLTGMLFYSLWQLVQLAHLALIVFSIIGIVNVVNHQQKELPLIGSLAHNFTF